METMYQSLPSTPQTQPGSTPSLEPSQGPNSVLMSLPFLHPHYSSPQQVLVCPRNEGFWGPELGKEMLNKGPSAWTSQN